MHMFTLVSHKPHFQKQRFEIVREKPAWIYVSAQKKNTSFYAALYRVQFTSAARGLPERLQRKLLSMGLFACFTQGKRLGAKHRGVVQPCSMTPAPRTALWSSDPDKGRSHKPPAPSPTTVPDWWAPSSSPLHPAELQPPSITALTYPCPGCNVWPLQVVIKLGGCHFVQGFTLSLLASSTKSDESLRELIKAESRAVRRV